MSFDVNKIRKDFPFFNQNPNLVYFDNAATTQKPKCVFDAISKYYSIYNANVHRGVYKIAEKATHEFESTRDCIANFIKSNNRESIIFTSGATESINLVAKGWAKHNLNRGDHILLTQMEHHSNIVPWHMLAKELELCIDFIPITDQNQLDIVNLDQFITKKTKLVSVVHQSNVLGTVNPINNIINRAHDNGAVVLIDGAQSVVHQSIDVEEMDCDFFVFSGHKIYGPTGVGILYGKMELLEQMKPLKGGGEMINEVTEEGFTLNRIPWKFEAGTPAITQVIALRSAIEYIQNLGIDKISIHENNLINYAHEKLLKIDGLELYSPRTKKGTALAFNISDVHSYDFTKILDEMGIAIRSGHHCAQPLMKKLEISSSSRASFAFYNTLYEVDQFTDSIEKSLKIL